MSNQDAERALDVLRAARTLTAELSVVRDLSCTLQAVVDGVTQLGLASAVMNLVRADGDLEVVAVSGPPELRDALFGVVERRSSWERLLAAGEHWGNLVYLNARVARDVAPEMAEWYPAGSPTPVPESPESPEPPDEGRWDPHDDLFAVMRDRQGALIGVLSVGDPFDGRLPGRTQRELLEMYAAHAAVALENARLRDAAAAALTSLQLEKERFRQAFAMAPTGMAMLSTDDGPDGAGVMLRVNAALCTLLGRSESDLLGGTLLDHIHPDDRADAQQWCGLDMESVERRYLHADGNTCWFAVSASMVAANGSDPGYRLVHMIDITATKTREELLQHDARHDPLTGLANRRALGEALVQTDEDGTEQQAGTALLFCDLDDFKRVNDRYGHDIGDRVLVEVGRRLQATARAGDVVARMGGDEFVVLGRDLDDVSALRLSRRLSAAVCEPMTDVVPGLLVTCTVGVAVGGPDADTADLLARADRHLLDTKRLASTARQARGRPRAR